MHIFNYDFLRDEMLPAQLVTIVSNISALKVMAGVRLELYAKAFEELETVAKIEPVKASNAIEGIVTTDKRIREMAKESSAPLQSYGSGNRRVS